MFGLLRGKSSAGNKKVPGSGDIVKGTNDYKKGLCIGKKGKGYNALRDDLHLRKGGK